MLGKTFYRFLPLIILQLIRIYTVSASKCEPAFVENAIEMVQVNYGGRGGIIEVDTLRVSMVGNQKFKQLLQESCSSRGDIFIHYKASGKADWEVKRIKKIFKGAVVVGGIDPCTRYDVKLVLGSGELVLASLGPYYEAVPEPDLARVGLEDGEQLHRPHLAAAVTVAQTNASTLSLGWGALCALSMSVYYRQEDGEYIPLKTIRTENSQAPITSGSVEFPVTPCTSYEVEFLLSMGRAQERETGLNGFFYTSDPALGPLRATLAPHTFSVSGSLATLSWDYGQLLDTHADCLAAHSFTLRRRVRGAAAVLARESAAPGVAVSSGGRGSEETACPCGCELEMEISLTTSLGTQHTFTAFTETVTGEKQSSLIVENSVAKLINIDCLDDHAMIQVVESTTREGRSQDGTDGGDVVFTQLLGNRTLDSVGIDPANFSSCAAYRINLVTEEAGGRRVIESIPFQNPRWATWSPPSVTLLDQTANLTRVVVTDEETRGSCAVSSYLVSCGQAEQEARPGATVQLRPGGGAACRVRIVHTIAGKEEPSLTTDWSPAFTPATTHLQLLQTQPMVATSNDNKATRSSRAKEENSNGVRSADAGGPGVNSSKSSEEESQDTNSTVHLVMVVVAVIIIIIAIGGVYFYKKKIEQPSHDGATLKRIQHLSGQSDDADKNPQADNNSKASKLPNIIEEDERLPGSASDKIVQINSDDTASQRSRHNSTYLY